MKQKTFIIGLLILFTLTFFGEEMRENKNTAPLTPPESSASILLDSIIVGFNKLAQKGSGGYEEVNNLLQNSMARLKKARIEKEIDEVFYARYKRILEVLKLAILEKREDAEGILSDLIGQKMASFAYDITGRTWDMEDPKNRGLRPIAGAIIWEILTKISGDNFLGYPAIYPALLTSITLLIVISLVQPPPVPDKWKPFFKEKAR